MKIAECHCHLCNLQFKIEFTTDMVEYNYMTCPICRGDECKVDWIMRNGDE